MSQLQSSLPLIVAVFKGISAEHTWQISSLSPTQFTAEKSDFEWFATTDRSCFCSTTSIFARNLNFFSLSRVYLIFKAFGRKKFWICLNPRFFMPCQSRAWSVARPSFRESGAAVADDVYPGTKHNGASVSSLYLLEKMERKTNRSNIFWD